MKQIDATKPEVKNLPETAGVYIFRDSAENAIYVGKAKNLKDRVTSYFSNKLAPKTYAMVNTAKTISYIPVTSEFEALLLEAKLVRSLKPRYNSELRDDKSPLYIGITKEEYPRVLTLRQSQLVKYSLTVSFGPFINSTSPKRVLKRIRKAIPFSTHKPFKRACVYNQIGLCDPCPSEIASYKRTNLELHLGLKKEYSQNIRKTISILSGNIVGVKKDLQKQIRTLAKKADFEDAQKILEQLKMLEYVTSSFEPESSYIKNPNLLEDIRARELGELKNILTKYFRIENLSKIECFDIAHIAGTYPTASMVTFVNGEPEKSLYRHYKVSGKKKNNDVDSMKLVLIRRKARFGGWGKPDLIIVDGGKGQVSAAYEVIGMEVPIVGIAKSNERLVIKTKEGFDEVTLNGQAKLLVQRIRNEAHRFARRYHHKLVSKAIREA